MDMLTLITIYKKNTNRQENMNVISEEFLLLEHGHENDAELAYE